MTEDELGVLRQAIHLIPSHLERVPIRHSKSQESWLYCYDEKLGQFYLVTGARSARGTLEITLDLFDEIPCDIVHSIQVADRDSKAIRDLVWSGNGPRKRLYPRQPDKPREQTDEDLMALIKEALRASETDASAT